MVHVSICLIASGVIAAFFIPVRGLAKDYKWELYNLNEDYSQANDLASQMPDKLKEMQALFAQEAKKYNVYPLQNSTFARAIVPRPSDTAGQTAFTYSGENTMVCLPAESGCWPSHRRQSARLGVGSGDVSGVASGAWHPKRTKEIT
jgi:hypothetical protein